MRCDFLPIQNVATRRKKPVALGITVKFSENDILTSIYGRGQALTISFKLSFDLKDRGKSVETNRNKIEITI